MQRSYINVVACARVSLGISQDGSIRRNRIRFLRVLRFHEAPRVATAVGGLHPELKGVRAGVDNVLFVRREDRVRAGIIEGKPLHRFSLKIVQIDVRASVEHGKNQPASVGRQMQAMNMVLGSIDRQNLARSIEPLQVHQFGAFWFAVGVHESPICGNVIKAGPGGSNPDFLQNRSGGAGDFELLQIEWNYEQAAGKAINVAPGAVLRIKNVSSAR